MTQSIVSSTARGAQAEDIACAYLRKQGLEVLSRNFRTPFGEIDLIMHHGDCVVFVEVRSRRRGSLTSPIESVDARKQQRLLASAEVFLNHLRADAEPPCRFDVIGIIGDDQHHEIEWVEDAFSR